MNVYDFDKTIYLDDSTEDFYFYLLRKKPKVLKYLPSFLFDVMKYRLSSITKTDMKETFFQYLNAFDNSEIDELIKDFWETHKYKIYTWYLSQKKSTDVIVSASPRYLLKPVCDEMNVSLICSEVDKNNGKYSGINCYGEEKVRRFVEIYPNEVIDEFYSDSLSDEPLARIAKSAYLVKRGGMRIPWIVNKK